MSGDQLFSVWYTKMLSFVSCGSENKFYQIPISVFWSRADSSCMQMPANCKESGSYPKKQKFKGVLSVKLSELGYKLERFFFLCVTFSIYERHCFILMTFKMTLYIPICFFYLYMTIIYSFNLNMRLIDMELFHVTLYCIFLK